MLVSAALLGLTGSVYRMSIAHLSGGYPADSCRGLKIMFSMKDELLVPHFGGDARHHGRNFKTENADIVKAGFYIFQI